MPISPKDALGNKPQVLKDLLARMATQIDEYLRRDFNGRNSVRYDILKGTDGWVLSKILKMYEDLGWEVKEESGSDMRGDDSWHYLTFTAHVPLE